MMLFRLVTGWASALWRGCAILAAQGTGQWDQPAGALADQIAGVAGPGPVTLSVRNLSSIADSEVPAIRAILEKDLKNHGISIANGDTPNTVRLTLSQNDRERLWVAEIVEGNETRVVMVSADLGRSESRAAADYLTLRRERLPILKEPGAGVLQDKPILGALEHGSSILVLRSYGIESTARIHRRFGEISTPMGLWC